MQLQRQILAGIPLSSAIRGLAALTRGRPAAGLKLVCASLDNGSSLMDAAKTAPCLFPGTSPALLGAAEKTGTVPAMLQSMIRLLDVEIDVRRSLLRTSLYPAFLIFAASFLLPLSTLITCGPGAYARNVLMTMLPFAGLAMAGATVRVAMFDEGVEDRLRGIFRHMPLVGRNMRNRALAVSLETMGLSIEAGLGLPESLKLAADAARDPEVRSIWVNAARAVLEGGSLAASLDARLPDEIAVAVATGEKTGDLAEALHESATTLFARYRSGVVLTARVLTGILLGVVVLVVARSILQSFLGVLNLDSSGEMDDAILKEIPGVFNQMPH
jgi:type II secretory pathway component PulF